MLSSSDKSVPEGAARRPLQINFKLYAHFKTELIDLMIENLQELQQSYEWSVAQGNMKKFINVCHKTKTALQILGDQEYTTIVENLKQNNYTEEQVLLFHHLTGEIITSLWIENGNISDDGQVMTMD